MVACKVKIPPLTEAQVQEGAKKFELGVSHDVCGEQRGRKSVLTNILFITPGFPLSRYYIADRPERVPQQTRVQMVFPYSSKVLTPSEL